MLEGVDVAAERGLRQVVGTDFDLAGLVDALKDDPALLRVDLGYFPALAVLSRLRTATTQQPTLFSRSLYTGTKGVFMGDVYVIGSINMDVVATASRHPTVGETVAGSALDYFPGGKGANQAVAAARAGARTFMVGRLGGDTFSSVLSEFLTDQGIDLQHVETAAGRPSGTALIVVAAGNNTIVVVPGANDTLRPEHVAALQFSPSDVAVAQFETPVDTTVAAFARAAEHGTKTVLNPAPAADIPEELLSLTDVVVVNETELSTISRRTVDVDKEVSLRSAVDEVRTKPSQAWIVTLGPGGILLSGDPGSAERIPGHEVPVKDTTGAGDCFVGVLAAEVAAGRDLARAAKTANAAAALCVQEDGAGPSMPTADAVSDFIGVAR